jgi:glycyl-tRNA synthetase beta chain
VRIEHLRQFASESEEFQALIQTFKRVGNILKKQPESVEVDENLLSEDCETGLLQAYHALRAEVAACAEKGDYKGALNVMARLREPVDTFFEGVEIMVKDNEPLRRSRVGLLQRLSGLFRSVADLSKFSI